MPLASSTSQWSNFGEADNYGVRKYDADIGRFLSVDKLYEQQPGYSPYHYAGNDPVNGSDGSGLFTEVARPRSSITNDDRLPDQISSGSWLTWEGSGAKGTKFTGGFGVETHPLPGGEYGFRYRVREWIGTSPLEPGHWGGWKESNDIFAAERGGYSDFGNRVADFGNFYRGGSGGGVSSTDGGDGSNKNGTVGYSYGEYTGLSKIELYGVILVDKAAEQFGIKDIAGLTLVLLGQNFSSSRGKFQGATPGTSIASEYLSKVLSKNSVIKLPTITGYPKMLGGKGMRIAFTKIIGRFIGRAIPFIGWGILAYDVGMVLYNTQVKFNQVIDKEEQK